MSRIIARVGSRDHIMSGCLATLVAVIAFFATKSSAAIQSVYSIVDDYSAPDTWNDSRIGTDRGAVQSTGMFALASVVAFQLGYIPPGDADNIVATTAKALIQAPRFNGLLPRFLALAGTQPTADSEWSSVDTSIALVASILASQFMGRDTSVLEAMLRQIDWADLTGHFTHSASHGYDQAGNLLLYRWSIFGGESFLLAVAFSAANPGQIPPHRGASLCRHGIERTPGGGRKAL